MIPASKKSDAERLDDPPRRRSGASVGSVVAFEHGTVWVTFDGTNRPVAARLLAGVDDRSVELAARERAEAVLLFEEGDPSRPLLIGLLRSAAPLVDALLAGPLPTAEKRVAHIDENRVEIEGKNEVVLRCGKASLTLCRDGKVVLRGVNVITQAEQVYKVRGGKVQVN